MRSEKYRDLEGAIDDQWDLSNDCNIQMISDLKLRVDWVRDAFDRGELTTEERNDLDKFAWKILTRFEEICVCKDYDPQCDPGIGLYKK